MRDSYSNSLFELSSHLLKDLWNASWNQTSVLVILSRSAHCERLSSTCLSIAKNSPIITLNSIRNDVFGAVSKNFFLTHIMKNFIEFEFPGLKLIINNTSVLIFWNCDCYLIRVIVYRNVLRSKVWCGSSSNDNFHSLS